MHSPWSALIWEWLAPLVGMLVLAWRAVSAAWLAVDRLRTSMPEVVCRRLDDRDLEDGRRSGLTRRMAARGLPPETLDTRAAITPTPCWPSHDLMSPQLLTRLSPLPVGRDFQTSIQQVGDRIARCGSAPPHGGAISEPVHASRKPPSHVRPRPQADARTLVECASLCLGGRGMTIPPRHRCCRYPSITRRPPSLPSTRFDTVLEVCTRPRSTQSHSSYYFSGPRTINRSSPTEVCSTFVLLTFAQRVPLGCTLVTTLRTIPRSAITKVKTPCRTHGSVRAKHWVQGASRSPEAYSRVRERRRPFCIFQRAS
jgi:hypothetical protein